MRFNMAVVMVCVVVVGATNAPAQACTTQEGWKKDFIPAAARDFSRTRVTQGGRYRVSVKAPESQPPTGRLHEWVLHVEDTSGVAIDSAKICVDGGMPEHGHGLPTSPEMNGVSNAGDYRIDGMKFSMSGWWVVKFVIHAPAGTDSVRFNIALSGNPRSTIPDGWSADELAKLQSLTLTQLGDPPADPSNRYASNTMAAAFGRRVFFDSSFSINGRVACATCHLPNRQFQDDRRLGAGVGTTGRRTMSLIASTYSPWLFWDGRADSPWAQALGPFESAVEHGGNRTLYARVVAQSLARDYERVFGSLPDVSNLPHSAGPNGTAGQRASWDRLSEATKDSVTRVFVNLGKSIEAFERGIRYGSSRFDRYVAGLGDFAGTRTRFSRDERAGARLFIGRAQCTRCHSGALLTDNQFHNVGVGRAQPTDSGRAAGIKLADASEFNCLGRYSDASPNDCAELSYAKRTGAELVGAFRTPSLRNVALRPPYGHDGELATLAAVLDHYNRAPAAVVGHSELEALHLTRVELRQLEAFLRTLDGPVLGAGPEHFSHNSATMR